VRQKIKTQRISIALDSELYNKIKEIHTAFIKQTGLPMSLSEFICNYLKEKMMGNEEKA
jgi:uncharacterized protein with PIN domain